MVVYGLENIHGVDFIGSNGAYDVAVAKGKVYYIGLNHPSYGNYIVVKHTFEAEGDSVTFYTQYCHMKDHSIVVNIGDSVVQGQVLGTQGMTRKCYM